MDNSVKEIKPTKTIKEQCDGDDLEMAFDRQRSP